MDDKCSICLNNIKYSVTLNCGHKFCYLCIKFVDELNGLCPICRKDIDIELNKLTIANVNDINETETYPCIKWLYNSNNRKNWWFYDIDTNEYIEKCYTEKSECKFDLGIHHYVIDFDNMIQSTYNTIRKIKRTELNNINDYNELIKNVKGIAGIHFDKK